MRPPRRALLALPALLPGPVRAQPAWPTRPLRLVVAWAPSGAIDTIARRLAQKLTEALGQSVVVDNRSGASGSIGAAEVARAAPDGYTLLALDSTYGMMPFLVSSLPFNHAEAFRLVTISAFTPVVAAVHHDSPYRTLRDLTEAARQRPETISYGSGGVGSSVQFATVAYELAAGLRLFHVPYRGGGEAVTALLGRQVDVVFASPSAAMMGGANAALRGLAISGPSRLASLPDVPTFAEAGLPGYDILHWSGLAVPRATPDAVVDRLHAEAAKALAAPDMTAFLASIAALPGGMPPAEAERRLAEDTARWREVVAAVGIRPQ
ncbi:tripartite tricarboxylate transporter substrate binding protein [Belnapia sp. T6]|uniref:Tripartite tricarboxylate transporter substrate binding protein n=1 Tax=Belnapia mucosa TaxID=2804532 RepID=A0ABS1UYW5_9PROT|nr:tripartite tricarboxylate transporter substrate-binding protein [Belnapia mucosa]MBL6454651.1 tripartite tricarboxylate transporter substrate binding protein [Belnapia mucosa]